MKMERTKFRSIRQIINDDYVWTTFEHTNIKKEK